MSLKIEKEDIVLPADQKGRLAFMLHNVLDPQESEDYIKWTEGRGYERPRLNSDSGPKQKGDTYVRNRDRCIVESPGEADKIWRRIIAYVPTRWMGAPVVGLNEKLMFLRYNPGQFFKPFADGQYVRDNGQPSQLTVLIYLNEDFEGGKTRFLPLTGLKLKDSKEHKPGGKPPAIPATEVTPRVGSALIFQQDLVREEAVVTKGLKYALRTDVMYAAGLPMMIKVRQQNRSTRV